MEIGILGALEVVEAGRSLDLGPYRQRAVLAILVLHVGEVVPQERLIELLWGDSPPNSATGSLQAYVSNLRRALEPDRGPRQVASILVTEAPGYRLHVDRDAVDAFRFQRLAIEGGECVRAGAHAAAIERFDAALAIWRGDALAEFRFEGFAAGEVARLDELHVATEEERIEARLACGDHDAVVDSIDALIAAHPLRERLRALQMVALHQSGQVSKARRAYDEIRQLLADEHGLEPGPQLRAALQQVERRAPKAASLVGRDGVLAVLDDAFADAVAGRVRVVLLGGEPGVGKTRLAEEIAQRAEAEGASVAWGRCQDDVGMPALWPWDQVVRDTQPIDDGASSISELLGTDDALSPTAALTVGDQSRFRLYERVRALLAARAAVNPIVVVLDDLHWADPSSLRLLRYLAVELSGATVLIVATFHEPGVSGEGPLRDALADLVRHAQVTRITIGPLMLDDVTALVRESAPALVASEVDKIALDLYQRTDGNAFFVAELLRLLDREHGAAVTDVPVVVQDVIRRRTALLPDSVRAVLGVASVIGREFDLDLVQRVAGIDSDDAFEILDAAVTAGALVESRSGSFRFPHGLVQETLYRDLSPGRRTRMHQRVADAIETSPGPNHDKDVSRLVLHFAAAGMRDATARYAELAAEGAERSLAYDAAARHWQTALDACGAASDEDGHSTRARLLLRLAAAHLGAGDATAGEDAHDQALGAAEASGDVALIAEAALAYGEVGLWQIRPYGYVDERVVSVISRALEMNPDGALRARLLVGLAIALYYRDDMRERCRTLAREAAVIARGLDDRTLRVHVLVELCVMLDSLPEREEQRALVDELESLLAADLPYQLTLTAGMRIARARLAAGDSGDLDEQISQVAQLAVEKHQAVDELWSTWARAGVAFIGGSLSEAEELANTAFALHTRLGLWGGPETYAMHAVLIWREQDRLAEFAPVVEPLLAEVQHPGARKLLAYFALARGAIDEIGTLLGPSPIPVNDDFTWLCEMCVTAELSAVAGHDCSADLYEQLSPYEGMVATMDGTFVCFGAVGDYLGLLAVALGRRDDAIRHFEEAIAVNDRVGAVPWSVRARMHLADLVADEPDRATRLRADALQRADAHELTAACRRLRSLRQ